MKRFILTTLTILLFISIFRTSGIATNASTVERGNNNSSEIVLMSNNYSITSTTFTISSGGKATVSVGYTGYKGITTHAKITTYVERKSLGLFWTRVDIGTSNNEWIDNPKEYQFSTSHSVVLSKTGQYRTVVIYTIYGFGGAADVVSRTIEKTYK